MTTVQGSSVAFSWLLSISSIVSQIPIRPDMLACFWFICCTNWATAGIGCRFTSRCTQPCPTNLIAIAFRVVSTASRVQNARQVLPKNPSRPVHDGDRTAVSFLNDRHLSRISRQANRSSVQSSIHQCAYVFPWLF